MFLRWLDFINTKKVVLASGSLQRINLLKEMGIQFVHKASDFAENLEKTAPEAYVNSTALRKFEEFLNDNSIMEVDILISADTIVTQGDRILEKPKDDKEIYEWFNMYSEKVVSCYTSVVIGLIEKSDDKHSIKDKVQFTSCTNILFDKINEQMVKDYIKTGEPYNRAGAFAIQGIGRYFIKKIDGCYYNVIGLPIQEFSVNLINLLLKYYSI